MYYHPEVDTQSVQSFQDSITEIYALQIKRKGCEQSPEIASLPECQSEEISNFHNTSAPYITMWDTHSNRPLYILHREAYSAKNAIECYCLKYNCHFEDTLVALRDISTSSKQVHNYEHPFLTILKNFCGYLPHHILNVGTNTGEYAASISQLFPAADVFMIEDNQDYEHSLQHLSSTSNRFQYEIADLETTTIDFLMTKHSITNIDFIKFDIQGAEFSGLIGAQHTLEGVDVVQFEIYFSFSIITDENDSSLSFFELHAYMDVIGFAVKDQGNISRDEQGELVSMTLFFVRKSSSLWDMQCSLFPPRDGYTTSV